MARVLPGTAPHVVAHGQADIRPALVRIEAHADAWRGQWIAVRLVDPVVLASAPTLTHLWQRAALALLKDGALHSIGTVENASQAQGPGWDV
ncbi:MAG TPA: hypothetical protein VI542_28560 [Candidatus Tectomicrobia bacterium]